MIDGQVDYSNHTREQLIDVMSHIDAQRFPLNHANAVRRLQELSLSGGREPLLGSQPDASETVRDKTREELRAEALQFVPAPFVYLKYSLANLLATFVAMDAYVLVAMRQAMGRAEAYDMNSLFREPTAIVLGWVAAVLVFVVLGKRHPRGYFINATIVIVISWGIVLALLAVTAPASLGSRGLGVWVAAFVADLCKVGIAGWICGLAQFVADDDKPSAS